MTFLKYIKKLQKNCSINLCNFGKCITMHFDITFIIFVSNCLLKVKYSNLLGWAFEYSLKSFSLRVEGFIFNFTFLCIFLVIKYTLKDRTRKFFAMRKIIGDRMCGSKKSNRHILKLRYAASSFIGQVICMDASNQKKVGRIYSTNECFEVVTSVWWEVW